MLENIFPFFVIFFVTCTYSETEVSGCERGCINGDCVVGEGESQAGGRCECWEGWRGEKCELCGGKVKLLENGTRNWLAEAVGNYTTNMKCTWVVEANKPDSRIRLHIKDFETECGWDHLYVWDGDNIFHGLQVSVLYGLGMDYVQNKNFGLQISSNSPNVTTHYENSKNKNCAN